VPSPRTKLADIVISLTLNNIDTITSCIISLIHIIKYSENMGTLCNRSLWIRKHDYCLTVSSRLNSDKRKLYVEIAMARRGVSHRVRAPTPSNNAGTHSVLTNLTKASAPPCTTTVNKTPQVSVVQYLITFSIPYNQTTEDYSSALAISSSQGQLVMSTQTPPCQQSSHL
jgi:hypothetical protein